MAAAPILRDIFMARKERWGDDDDGYTFEGPDERIDVFVYRANAGTPMTSLATIGMAARTMPGTELRTELHLARRGVIIRDEEHKLAVQLANLASHPWSTGSHFDWGHMISVGGDIPAFAGCGAVFFSGPFTDGGWDYIRTGTGAVRILNVVPITEEERARARTMAPDRFMSELMKEVDIFSGR